MKAEIPTWSKRKDESESTSFDSFGVKHVTKGLQAALLRSRVPSNMTAQLEAVWLPRCFDRPLCAAATPIFQLREGPECPW